MSNFTFEPAYAEARNRLTVAFRIILAIPHLIIAQVWGYLAQILAVIQWFIVLFTGKRNAGMWNLQRSWLEYDARVLAYTNLLYDEYPGFAATTGGPVRTGIDYEESANRLTNGLRLIWIIPAAIISALLAIAAFFVAIVSWFAIVITGKHPRGMWDFIAKALRYQLQTQAYGLLMTDSYPSYGGEASAPAPMPAPTV